MNVRTRIGLWLGSAFIIAGCASQPAAPPPPPEPEPAAEALPDVAPQSVRLPEPPPAPLPGEWSVSALSVRTAQRADSAAVWMKEKGYAVEIRQAQVEGTRWYRLVIPDFASREDAKALAGRLEQELGLKGAWALPPGL